MSDVDLSVSFCGARLETCLMNASGCGCTTEEELRGLCVADIGAVVGKSGTVSACPGHAMPRFYRDDYGSINAMGLPNPGFRFYCQLESDKALSKPFVQSIHPFSTDELRDMLREIDKACHSRSLVEVNLSCPNVGTKKTTSDKPAFHLDTAMMAIREAKVEKCVVGIKITACRDLIEAEAVASLLVQNQDIVEFVTCCNSVPNGFLIQADDESTVIHARDGFGGIGGLYAKPFALATVRAIWLQLRRSGAKTAIIGCGGVSCGQDVFEYLLCGATAVQIGTQLVRRGPQCFSEISDELRSILRAKRCTSVDQVRGRVRVLPPVHPSPPEPKHQRPLIRSCL